MSVTYEYEKQNAMALDTTYQNLLKKLSLV